MTRMTLANIEAHQRRVNGEMLHVKHSKHRPTPKTALIAEAAERTAKSKYKKDGTNFASRQSRVVA